MKKLNIKNVVLAIILILFLTLTSGCLLEERLGDIVYDDFIPPTLPPVQGASPGKGIYDANCAGCHGMGGQGSMPNTPDFTSAAYWDGVADEDTMSAIKNGREGTPMPAFADLSDKELTDVLAYMKSFAGL
jgi:mono/diheme cytochrome c family protein